MSWTPENSRIAVNASLEEQIAAALTASEIQRLLREAAVNQGAVRPDIYDPNVLLEVPAGDPARAQGRLARTVTVNGQKYILEGNSESELNQAETAVYRQIFQPDAATEQARGTDGRFVEVPAERSPADRVAADLVTQTLREQGIEPSDLREFSEQKLVQSFAEGVETFKRNHPDWSGGQRNMEAIGNLIMNSPEAMAGLNPAEQIEAAYQHALQNGMLDDGGEEAATIRKIATTTDPYELRRILQPNVNRF